MELLTSTTAQAEFTLMVWEMLVRLSLLAAIVMSSSALAAYATLILQAVTSDK